MLSDNVSRQHVRQGLGVERAGGAAGLQFREQRESDLLDERVAGADPSRTSKPSRPKPASAATPSTSAGSR